MTTRAVTEPPGGVLLWLIVTLELITFAMVFGLIAHQRSSSPASFAQGQAALSLPLGLSLTLVLVTSGAVAARAVHHHRLQQAARARAHFLAAAGLGLVFVGLKLFDYAQHLGAGHRLGSSDFWDAYFLGTGFHFLHVVVGLGLLVGVAARVGRAKFSDEETAIVGSALFWHMCDVAWFFLFPLFFARA